MKSYSELPLGYREILSINLQTNKKLALFINILAIIIGFAMAVPMHFYIPINALFSFKDGMVMYFIKFAVLLISIFVYMILHELVHGAAMKICGTEKIKYGFTGLYAFAGSDDYYDKKSYIFIALAPVILWGIVLAVINLFIPTAWFWVAYFVQICNISGAAGDIYVTFKFSRLPREILILDKGVGMTVYAKN